METVHGCKVSWLNMDTHTTLPPQIAYPHGEDSEDADWTACVLGPVQRSQLLPFPTGALASIHTVQDLLALCQNQLETSCPEQSYVSVLTVEAQAWHRTEEWLESFLCRTVESEALQALPSREQRRKELLFQELKEERGVALCFLVLFLVFLWRVFIVLQRGACAEIMLVEVKCQKKRVG